MKPYAMITALFLFMSASASAATPSSAPVNSIDRSGRTVQSLGSRANVGAGVHDKAHRLEVGRMDASLARTGAGFGKAGGSLKTGGYMLARNVNARWDAVRAATGNKHVPCRCR